MPSEEKVKIGGWLVAVGIFLWSNVILAPINIMIGLSAILTHATTTVPEPLVSGVANFILMLVMLVMFHKRKAALVRWVIICGIYAVLDECYVQYLHVIAHSSTTFVESVIAVILEALQMTGVVMYFFKSRRVKRTFVR